MAKLKWDQMCILTTVQFFLLGGGGTSTLYTQAGLIQISQHSGTVSKLTICEIVICCKLVPISNIKGGWYS